MKNSVYTLMTLEGTKEELKSLRTKTKAWASKKCVNGPSVDILDIGPMSEEKRLGQGLYSFEIYYQTNEKEHSKMWEEILKKKAPSVRMYYLKEEGNKNSYSYETNDKEGRYYPYDYTICCNLPTHPDKAEEIGGNGVVEYLTVEDLRENLTEAFGDLPLPMLIQKAKSLPEKEDEYVEIQKIEKV